MTSKPKGRSRTGSPARSADAVSYKPTAHERAAARRLLDHRAEKAPAPAFKVMSRDGEAIIEADHPEPAIAFSLLATVFGTGDMRFAEGLLQQIAMVSRTTDTPSAIELNSMIATVHAIGPRDPTEALLAAQMAAIHQATMRAAGRLNRSETIDQHTATCGALNKLARTFATQIEALKRYRSAGEQIVKVTHQHVSVTAGQAVVGIGCGGGGTHENASQSHALEPTAGASPHDAGGTAMLGKEQAFGLPLPRTGRKGAERLPHARRASRSADRKG